ncbi:hypothetical protein O6H91_06G015800 [Diphasiastrum complanatum]|uniref:Uncharacterized protein n=1 Tax=Diphasiastrum complanatum TaxID=34168 RepID=A0ACC2DB77_DIPCM|nr:hypothetical protein O6H91_06G015800 [Diphasiastrum complanatum]
MEESEKRRERLRAMQREAQQHADLLSASPSLLAPPRLDEATGMADTTPSFDFYTDPLAAFSAARRKSFAPPPSSRPTHAQSPEMGEMRPPWSGYHLQQQYQGPHISPVSSNSSRFHPQQPYQQHQQHQLSPASSNSSGASALRPPWPGFPSQHQLSPSGFPSPAAFAGQPIWQPSFHSPTPPVGTSHRSPVSGMQNSPSFQTPSSFSARPLDGRGPLGSPSQRNASLGFRESSHGYGGRSSGGRGSPRIDYNKSPGGRGSPWLDSGRSSERSMPRSGGGRGQRFTKSTPVSARDHPELFYKKSMVEDPWKNLAPKPYPAHDDNQSWLPKSINSKKPKSVNFKQQASGLSLADSLESAFAAAVADSSDSGALA